jgi:membrane protein implicated in regulation of membrane protease activity
MVAAVLIVGVAVAARLVVLALLALLLAAGVFTVLCVLALLGMRFLFRSPDDRRGHRQQHQQASGRDQVGP